MKKIILAVFVLCLFLFKSYGQCTPDPNLTYNGISPESLPNAMAGYEYWAVLSFKIPKDSSVNGIDITIDKAQFLYAQGQPSGFSFYCNTAGCVWAGGTKGCALFNGKVDSTFTGDSAQLEYPMKIYTMTWFRFKGGSEQFSRIDSATNYTFRILKYNGIGEITTYQNLTAYPNPTNRIINIELRDLAKNNSEVKIMDAFGKLIYQNTVSQNTQFLNTLSVDLSAYKTGLYFITVKSGDKLGMTKVLLHQ